jgi:TPR repeat protein
VQWYRKAADQDYANAQYYLGQMYRLGHGVQRNYAEAAKWFHRAAVQGHASAQYYLGFMCEAGLGVPVDLVQAYMWFDVAARSFGTSAHQQYAIQYRDNIASKMNLGQLFKARILAAEWRPEPSR